MPIAAVPHYLGSDFKEASVGLRFGMYLSIWGINQRSGEPLWSLADLNREVRGQDRKEREVTSDNKRPALNQACSLTDQDARVLEAWLERQQALAQPLVDCGALVEIHAQSVAPLTTGLGSEHPTENGFAFLWPYGLPYLPGSGVKGVMRQAARELGWKDIEILFGSETPKGRDVSLRRGALIFWDVLPKMPKNCLRVDVMTPHQQHYYQPKSKAVVSRGATEAHSCSPHDSGQPVPINFLTVPPKSDFVFRVQCDLQRLNDYWRDGHRWKSELQEAFKYAFEWLGFGAKTAVGYGALRIDEHRQAQATAEQQKRQRSQHLSPAMMAIEEFKDYMARKEGELKGRKTSVGQAEYQEAQKLVCRAQQDGWGAQEKAALADAIEQWVPKVVKIEQKDLRKKLGLATLRASS